MDMNKDEPMERPDGYEGLVSDPGYPDYEDESVVEEKVKKKGVCHCLRGVTCLLSITIFLFVLSSVLFGYGMSELNAAEFFVPYFDGGNGYNSTELQSFENKNKTCTDMHKWFKGCIPMKSSALWNLCVSFFAIGGLIGALAAGPISNLPFLGRKWTLWVSALIYVFSCCLKVLFSNFYALLFGRILHGIASGMGTTVVPMYINEISPKHLAGPFSTFSQLGITGGIFITQFISIFTSKSQWWRVLLGWPVCFGIIQLMTIPFVPHSPKYLIDQNRIKKARKALCRLRHTDEEGVKEEFATLLSTRVKGDDEDEELSINVRPKIEGSVIKSDEKREKKVEEEEEEEKEGGEKKEEEKSFQMKLISWKTFYHLSIAMTLQLVQQLSGINAIMFYSTKVYSTIFPQGNVATVLSAITMFINMLSVIPAVFLVEIIGRKWLLLIGTVVDLISMLGVTVFQVIMYYAFDNKGPGATSFGILTISSVLVYIAFFECSIGPIPWFIVSELFSTNLRPYAQGIACATNWLATFAVGEIFPIMQDKMNMWCFLVFVVCMIFAIIFIIFCVMETKGKEVKEVCETPYYKIICFCEVPKWGTRLWRKFRGVNNDDDSSKVTQITTI